VSALLALTDSAVEAVKDIVSSSEVPETGGLRMVAERAGTSNSASFDCPLRMTK